MARKAVYPTRFEHKVDLYGQMVEVVDGLGRIDLDNLREEVEGAGADSVWIGGLSARANRRAAEMRASRDVIRAQAEKDIRDDAVRLRGPGETPASGGRVTDQAVTAMVTLRPEVQQATTAYLKAQEDADVLESLKFSIARKQATCEALVSLLVAEELARRNAPPLRHPI